MHQVGLVALYEVGRPTITSEQLLQFLTGNTRQDGWVGNLVAVQVQDRQHRAVGGRIEKLVGMPRRRQRSRFCLAIADDAANNQIGIVEYRPERMAEGIAQLASLMD